MADAAGAVRTRPTQTFPGVFEQRKRWGSKTVHYGIRQIMMLSGVFSFYCAVMALLCAGIFVRQALVISACMMLVKIAGEAILMFPGTKIMGQEGLRKYLIVGSLIQLPMVIFSVVLGVFGRFAWKDQRFKRKAGQTKL
jgi:predicted membrane-bound dolichyl-phosphate-mannose-protein mannosyltransferase